jgi:ABC-2 type transport system permease protein
MTTPLREIEYVLGLGVYGIAKLTMAMASVSLVAFGFYGFGLGQIGWGLVPIALVLLIVGWASSMFVIGLLLRFGQSAEILAWATTFVVLALSGVFNPVRAIPGPLQPIARVLPTTNAFGAARAILDGKPMPWGSVGAGLVGALAMAVAGVWFVVRMLATFRRRGYVTRFS